MDEVLDWLWRYFSSLEQPKSRWVKKLTLEVPVSYEQARLGGNAKNMVPARAICPTCRGQDGVGFYGCSRCAGEGAISGEIPISAASPPGLTRGHTVMITLERFGIRNDQIRKL